MAGRLLVLLLAVTGPGADAAHAQQGAAIPAPPKIGLVLSGGSAKGLAHIGVIRTLEEIGVPIDVISGTSMGALVGGLYASGVNSGDLQEIASGLDWSDVFTDKVNRRFLAPDRRLMGNGTLITYPLRNGSLLPSGAVRGETVQRILERLTWGVHRVNDFARLPIPFVAVATDLQTGEAVVLRSGRLSEALRASMGLPAVFEPIRYDDRVLVDGGFVRNLPAEDAIELGADFLICSDVSGRLNDAEEIHTLFDVLMQTITFQTAAGAEPQRELCDILIQPDLEGMSGTDFSDVDAWIERGRQAALEAAEQLRKVANGGDRLGAVDAGIPILPDTIRVVSVSVEGTSSPRSANVVRRVAALRTPATHGAIDLDEAVARLYATGLYSRATYRIEPEGADTAVVFEVTEQPSNELSFGFRYDDHRHASLLFSGKLRNALGHGSTVRVDLRLGTQLRIRGIYLQPPGVLSQFGHEVDVNFTRAAFDIFDGNQRTAEIHARVLDFGAGAEMTFSPATIGALRTSMEFINENAAIAPADSTEWAAYATAGVEVFRHTFDRRSFPTSGSAVRARAILGESWLGDLGSFTQQVLEVERIIPISGHSVMRLAALIGGSTGGELPIHREFHIGGAYSSAVYGETQPAFWGLRTQERTGRAAQVFRVAFQREVRSGTFATAGINVGNTFESWVIRLDDYIFGWALALGASTLLGPVEVTMHGRDLSDRPHFDLNIGLVF
jgi:NTE family protein